MPTVSIILPTYNRAHVLGRAIQSVLDQTFPDFELIIVDDGSNDNTDEVIRSFQDPRIRYIKHNTNRGGSAARNTGIKSAEGEYVAFQDSDDEWLHNKLELQTKLFNNDKQGNLGVVLCGMRSNSNNTGIDYFPLMQHINRVDLLSFLPGGYHISTIQFLIKKSITLPELRFDENLPAYQDWDLLVRIIPLCRIECVPDILVQTYVPGGERITSGKNRLGAKLIILEKYKDELKKYPPLLSRHHKLIAIHYHRIGLDRYILSHLKSAIVINPCELINYFYFFSAFFGHCGFGAAIRVSKALNLFTKVI